MDIFKGSSQVEAYTNHYKTGKSKLATVAANASRLASNDKVSAKISELKERVH